MQPSKLDIRFIVALLLVTFMAASASSGETNMTTWRKLTPEEEQVIVHKGTERPGSGAYEKLTDAGTYTCKRCGAALYRAEDKFDAGCGWPSFDTEVPGAVKRSLDADGSRTEITCVNCGAHLGHVFTGEKITKLNTRHCVNSISLAFVPLAQSSNHFERAIFAGGCFWGVQYMLKDQRGVIRTTVGYTGGHTDHPTYDKVCSHTTGHAEACEVWFDPRVTTFEKITRYFFEIHDPTQADGQGPDLGDQYRSAVFYTSDAQKTTTEKLIAELRKKKFNVVTQVVPAVTFWPAEAYHQNYYVRTGHSPYCHRHVTRFDSPVSTPPSTPSPTQSPTTGF
jgi:peptide methionine sulfoxide reductase msrA/msrB